MPTHKELKIGETSEVIWFNGWVDPRGLSLKDVLFRNDAGIRADETVVVYDFDGRTVLCRHGKGGKILSRLHRIGYRTGHDEMTTDDGQVVDLH